MNKFFSRESFTKWGWQALGVITAAVLGFLMLSAQTYDRDIKNDAEAYQRVLRIEPKVDSLCSTVERRRMQLDEDRRVQVVRDSMLIRIVERIEKKLDRIEYRQR